MNHYRLPSGELLTLVTAPAAEPLSTAEAKAHARIDGTDSDTLIDAYIKAARLVTEDRYGVALVTQTWDLALDRFPCGGTHDPYAAIDVPRPPLQSVTSVTYTDTAGTATVLSSSLYQVQATGRAMPGRIAPAYAQTWPATRDVMAAVTVRFVAGYGLAAAVPEDVKTAIKFLVAHWYENREIVGAGGRPDMLPFTYEALLAPYRQYAF